MSIFLLPLFLPYLPYCFHFSWSFSSVASLAFSFFLMIYFNIVLPGKHCLSLFQMLYYFYIVLLGKHCLTKFSKISFLSSLLSHTPAQNSNSSNVVFQILSLCSQPIFVALAEEQLSPKLRKTETCLTDSVCQTHFTSFWWSFCFCQTQNEHQTYSQMSHFLVWIIATNDSQLCNCCSYY